MVACSRRRRGLAPPPPGHARARRRRGAARRQRLQRAPGDENGDPNLLLSPGPDFLSPRAPSSTCSSRRFASGARCVSSRRRTPRSTARRPSFISPSVPVIVARARRARETERRGRNCTRMFGRPSSARSSSAPLRRARLRAPLGPQGRWELGGRALPACAPRRGAPAPAPTLCLPAPGDCRWSWRRMLPRARRL